MISSPTVKLSIRRAFLPYAPAFVLLWIALPALAAPIPVNGASLPLEELHQSGLTRQFGVPSIVFAKKNGNGNGGGGSGNSGEGKDKKDNKDRKDKKDTENSEDAEDTETAETTENTEDTETTENTEDTETTENTEDTETTENTEDTETKENTEGTANTDDTEDTRDDEGDNNDKNNNEDEASGTGDTEQDGHDESEGGDGASSDGTGENAVAQDQGIAGVSPDEEPASDGTESASNTVPDENSDTGSSTNDPAPYLMISGTPPEAVTAGDLYLFTPGLESDAEDPPVFMIEGLPHWAGFNAINGELYGAPAEEDIGFYDAITISATDGVIETSLPTFSIEVVAPGAAPGAVTLSWMPPTANEDGSYLVDLAGYWIYWGNNPGQYTEWMRIDNPGLTTVVIESLVPGTWEFAMTSFNAADVESKLSNAVTRFVD